MNRTNNTARRPMRGPGTLTLAVLAALTLLIQPAVSASKITAPGVPGYVTAQLRGTKVLVTWNAPANGGAPITAYYVYANGKKVCTSSKPSCLVKDLPVAVEYRFTVMAKNRVGLSPMSTRSFGVTPFTKATAPTIRMVTLSHNTLTLNFSRPSTNGGAAVSGYDYSLNGGRTWKSTKQTNSPLTITGVVDGHTYSLALRAVNRAGAGPKSATFPTTRVAFFGDSLVWGQGAENVAGWSKQVAQKQKWQQINFSVRGTGFNKPNLDTTSCVGFKNVPSLLRCASAYKPDVVVISAGINDCDYVSIHPVQTKQKVETTLWRAKTLFPNAQILVTSVVSFTSKQCWNTLNGWISDAAADAGVEYASEASTWVLGRTDMQVDGVHPNDLGHTEIANRFSDWFESLPK